MPRVIEVIESQIKRGRGENGDPVRTVYQYHTLCGKLLAERDTWEDPISPELNVPPTPEHIKKVSMRYGEEKSDK